ANIKPEMTNSLQSSDEKKGNNINDKAIFEQRVSEKIVDGQDLGTIKKIAEQATIDSVNVQMKQTQSIVIPMDSTLKDQAQLSNKNVSELNTKQIIDTQMNKENLLEQTELKKTPHFDEKREQGHDGFSKNSDFINVTGKATEAAQDFAEQSSASLFNASVNTEVIQTQKSNTQLHQETIAIFRKDFTDAVKDKVMLMISQKLQQFDITLDPPELGNMHVRVNLQGEQAVVNFMVQNPQAKEALEQNMHKLREMLAEQGVDVGDANVEQHSQQENDKNTAENQHNGNQVNTVEASDAIEHTFSAQVLKSSNSAIDYYA
ncbi:MAG: flagellar hook-length control protein FliK, partial [Colwellia sp.]